MNCKFCGAKIERNMDICPECGLDIPLEDRQKNDNTLKIVLAVIAGILLLAVLVGVVLYSLGIFNTEKVENNDTHKDSYTADEKTSNKESNAVIATAGDKKLDNGVFQFYYAMEVIEFLNENSYYLSYMNLDPTKPLDEQYVSEEDDITWEQRFIETAIDGWYDYSIMNMMAAEEGYVLSEEMQKTIDSFDDELQKLATNYGFMDAQSLIQADFGEGYKVEDYYRYWVERYSALDYVSSLYEKIKPTQ